jgi:chromosome segregation protein
MERDVEPLTTSFEKASEQRANLREQIADLGFINLEALEEYAKVKGDYDELFANTKDLRESKDKLLSTIDKMDEIMKTQFLENFEKVNTKFDEVFKTLFRGGKADLSLEDPENILESGVLIQVQAPGKAVNSMRLLSGGEKSLTALSLVFAINLVRELPLLILDEPEAALDEANVERFAKFAKSLNEHSQVIVTTHRPGTMELADVIYGVTMQKKGITKIVTVKLEDAVEMTQ